MMSIDPVLDAILKEQKELKGIQVDQLPKGTKINVTTKNSLYKMETLRRNKVYLQGGTCKDGSITFPEKTLAYFLGSNFGGSAIKMGYIGYGLFMEFQIGRRYLITSSTKTVQIIAPDNSWSYEME